MSGYSLVLQKTPALQAQKQVQASPCKDGATTSYIDGSFLFPHGEGRV